MSKLINELIQVPMAFSDFMTRRKPRDERKLPSLMSTDPPKEKDPMTRYKQIVKDKLERRGWKLYKSGWPDFFCVKENGKCMLIVAKGPTEKLRSEQVQMRKLFLRHFDKMIYIARSDDSGHVSIS